VYNQSLSERFFETYS